MSLMTIILWVSAITALLAAHIVRTIRQTYLFRTQYAVERRFDLLAGLSLGYAYNTFLPFRLGELIRIFYISSRSKIQFSIVAGTVIAERISDLIFVALLLLATSLISMGNIDIIILRTAIIFTLIAIIVIIGTILVDKSKTIRRFVWDFANIFNDRIAIEIVNIIWTSSDLIKRDLLSPRYLFATIAMWSGYILSYWLFAQAAGFAPFDVINDLLGTPMNSLAHESGLNGTNSYLIFTFIPVLLILIYGAFKERAWLSRIVRFGVPRIYTGNVSALFGPFREFADYGLFLKSHFSATRPLIADFSLYGLQDETIQRILPGGSDALTAVVEIDDKFCIRKFAIGEAAKKLQIQSQWLRDYHNILPLCDVTVENIGEQTYTFDMPYLPFARDFYEFIHTSPREEYSKFFIEIASSVYDFHTANRKSTNDTKRIDEYLEHKVIKNARAILEFVQHNLGDNYSINGITYSLSEWNDLFDIKWLRNQVKYHNETVVHGDLTLENIIVTPKQTALDTVSGRGTSEWYIIDPNPENIFNSELIDWAKMMQSLHLGYEWLNRTGPCKVENNDIRLISSRSDAYGSLYRDLLQFLEGRFDKSIIREILFHEIVNYLRLIPYKIRHTPERALTFFAAVSVLIRQYKESENV